MSAVSSFRRCVSWRRVFAAGVFALLCFALVRLLAPQREADLFETYGRFLLAALFGGLLLREGLPRERVLLLHLAYLAWLLVTRWLNGDFYLFVDRELVRAETLSYLMLSVGLVLPPDGRRRLLNLLSWVYAGFFVLFSALGLFVAVTGTYIHLPPENVWITMRAEGNPDLLLNLLSSFRLTAAGRVYLSMGLLGYQAVRTRRVWLRALLLVGVFVLYCAIALLYSHTIWAATGISCGMLVVLLLHRAQRPQRPLLRAGVLSLSFLLVAGSVFFSFLLVLRARDALRAELAPRFAAIYTASAHRLDPEYFGIAGEEAPIPVEQLVYRTTREAVEDSGDLYLDPPRSFNQTLTLSWRTLIWESSFYCIRREPMLLLRGHLTKGLMDRSNRYLYGVYRLPLQPNMHSFLFQALMLTGLPGFLLLLAWALISASRMLRVYFAPKEAVPLPIAYLTIPLTGMFVFNLMEYQLFPAWDSSSQGFLLVLGVFTGLYRELYSKEKNSAA